MREAVSDASVAQPVRNLLRNTFTKSTSANTSQIGPTQPVASIDAATKVVGDASLTKVRAAGSGVGSLGLKAYLAPFDLRVGMVIRWGFWVRASVNQSFAVYWEYVSGPAYQGGTVGTLSLTAGTWTWVTGQVTVTAAMLALTQIGVGGYASTAAEGTQLWWNGIRVSVDAPLPDLHLDGDVPGWRWTGAAGASESVGHPYTLESIAGRPIAAVTGIGTAPLTLTQMPALAGRTTYCVVDKIAVPSSIASVIFGNVVPGNANQTGYIRMNISTVGGNSFYEFRPQFDGGGGAAGAYGVAASSGASAPVAGTRNVVAVAQVDGLTSLDFQQNGITSVSRAGMVVGNGYPLAGLSTQVAKDAGGQTLETPVYAAQYLGYHGAETRKRITAWLARKYGSPIPAGY